MRDRRSSFPADSAGLSSYESVGGHNYSQGPFDQARKMAELSLASESHPLLSICCSQIGYFVLNSVY
jgi:hypothetical protein